MQQNSKWQQILIHDVEAAAFLIVTIMLASSITSYALDAAKVIETTKVKVENVIDRNPVSVTLEDVNGDGLNDIVLIHESGTKEIVYTNNN